MAISQIKATKLALLTGIFLSLPLLTASAQVSQEFLDNAEFLAQKGIISAQKDTAKYRLADPITRAEMAKIIFGFYNTFNSKNIAFGECSGKTFSDVTTKLDLCKYIEALAANKIITVQDKFRPNDNLIRAEMVTMLLRGISVSPSTKDAGFSDVTAVLGSHQGYINAALELGIISPGAKFRPLDSASRGEVFTIIARILRGGIR